MSSVATSWVRTENHDLAVEKILDGAEQAFIELGVSAATMAEIARYAGCSRRTLYRYFADRHDLHIAYVNRAAKRIVAQVHAQTAQIQNPQKRLCQAMLTAIAEVRKNPGTAAWFVPGAAELAARMSRASDVVQTLTNAFISQLVPQNTTYSQFILSGRWLVRVIVSFLAMPGQNPAEEQTMIEHFVVPLVLPQHYPTANN